MSGTHTPPPGRGFSWIAGAKTIEDARGKAGFSSQICNFGPLHLELTLTESGALAAVRLPEEPPAGLSASHLSQALQALQNIPLAPPDDAARQAFQAALCQIPPGSTSSYGDLAARLQTSPRAIASRCAANPILLRIPCHRVTAKTHAGGFQAGPAWKSLLLRLESELCPSG
jgi:O-6-methylguanine DNA methyltransferase